MTGTRLENTLIHLLGFPGTGKLTIAKELVALSGARLVDNHLINNPVFSLIHQDGKTKLPPRVWDNVGLIWDAVLDTIEHISPRADSFILTNALFDDDAGDHAHVKNIADMAQRRGGVYMPIRLVLSDVEEHKKRITAPNRSAQMKSTDAEAPARYLARQVLMPDLPHVLTLDVTHIRAPEAAQQILDHAVNIGKGS